MTDNNLQNKVIEPSPNVFVVKEVYSSFTSLASKCQKDFEPKGGLSLEIAQSFVSRVRVAEELRQRAPKQVGQGTPYTSNRVTPDLIDTLNRPIANVEDYNKVLDFIYFGKGTGESLSSSDFNPPLPLPVASTTDDQTFVYGFPYFPQLDPRATGRLVVLGPTDILKRNDVRSWLYNNSLLYGFLVYGNIGLYYVGVEKIKDLVKNTNLSLVNIISTYQTQLVDSNIITVTQDEIEAASSTAILTVPTAGADTGVVFTTAENPNEECTRVVRQRPGRSSTTIETHTGREKQFYKREVRSIILHETVSNNSAQNTVDYVCRCGSTFIRGGIHYAVDRTGTIVAGIPEDVYSVHGHNWNTNGIGVEVSTYSSVTPTSDPTKFRSAYRPTGTPDLDRDQDLIIQLPYFYEDHQHFQEFTDIQIQALETLIRDILVRYPRINQEIQGKNLYKEVFGLVNGKPSPGDSVSSKDAPQFDPAGYGAYGIFVHNTGGGTHHDMAPTPKIVEMLKRLGYNETA